LYVSPSLFFISADCGRCLAIHRFTFRIDSTHLLSAVLFLSVLGPSRIYADLSPQRHYPLLPISRTTMRPTSLAAGRRARQTASDSAIRYWLRSVNRRRRCAERFAGGRGGNCRGVWRKGGGGTVLTRDGSSAAISNSCAPHTHTWLPLPSFPLPPVCCLTSLLSPSCSVKPSAGAFLCCSL